MQQLRATQKPQNTGTTTLLASSCMRLLVQTHARPTAAVHTDLYTILFLPAGPFCTPAVKDGSSSDLAMPSRDCRLERGQHSTQHTAHSTDHGTAQHAAQHSQVPGLACIP
jgi:hypothetical protein